MSLVQSVERTFEVLEAVAAQPAGISELGRRVDLPASTVSRLLRTLEKIRMVERDEQGLFRLGPKAFALTNSAARQDATARIDVDYLNGLAGRLGEVAGFSIRSADDALYLAQAASHHEVQIRDWTGERVPLHVVSSGLVFLAFGDAQDTSRYLDGNLKRFNSNTVVDADIIRTRLEQIRASGYCWTRGEFDAGINSIAAPIFGPGETILGALHCHGPSYRFPTPGEEDRIAAILTHAAAQFAPTGPAARNLINVAD